MNKRILKNTIAAIACTNVLTLGANAASGVVLSDNFESGILNDGWLTRTSTNCFVTVSGGKGIQGGNALELNDGHDGTMSPYYEGFAKAMHTFTPQKGEMTVEFYFHSNNIPIGHEKVILGMGETAAFEMMLNNHGQNAHIRFNNAGEFELLNGISANMWHKAKIKVNVKNNSCEFYLDDMDECKIRMSLAKPVEYIDRISFETGKDLGEKSVFRIDNLTVNGTKKAVETIDADVSLEVGKGAYKNLNAKAMPYDATDRSIAYTSKNNNIATVDEKGVVFGVSEGNTDILMTTADGVSKICKVTVGKNAVIKSDIDFSYDYKTHKLVITGAALRGEGSIASVLITEGENQIYFGQCEADKEGRFLLAVPYTAKENKKITAAAKFSSGEAVKKSITYNPDVLQSEISFEKEVYVTKLGQDEKLNVAVETSADERPVLTYGHKAKKTYTYGGYVGSADYYVGTVKVDGENNYYTDNAEEGDYFVTVSTNEAVKASAKALVQVNSADASIEDTDSNTDRTVKVTLPAKTVAEKIKNGKPVRLAAGYAELNVNSSYAPKEEIVLEVVKKKTPADNCIAEYKLEVSENLKNISNVIKFPMDFVADKISDYNLISVYGSEDGSQWVNLKADLESGTNYMVVNTDKVYPYIQIKENEDKNTDHFAKAQIYSLYSKGIYTEAQMSAPESFVTSAELADVVKAVFADSKDISGGNDYITREKAAVAIYNALGFKAINENSANKLDLFKDAAGVDANCRTALNTLCVYRVFNGDEASNINPKNNITVGELAVIISRLK